MTADAPAFKNPLPNLAWLAGRTEEIIDPTLPIIDPHHHLWDRDGGRYYLDELLADIETGHNIVGTVFVQCAWAYRTEGPEYLRPVGETEFVANVAQEAERRGTTTRVCLGIVGHADLRLGPRVDEVLAAHIRAGVGRFRGIRHITARTDAFTTGFAPPPAHLMQQPDFRAGFAQLEDHGLSFDAWLYHTQISELTELARSCPAVPVVLDHVGGPLGIGPYQGQRDEVFATWRADMRQLASCPNVHVKLGGLAMLISGFGFHEHALPPSSEELAHAWRPYLEAVIEDFGTERCMFESNFPVDKGMCSYPVLWNAFKRVADGASAAEKANLFHDTAARFYDLAV